MGSEEKKLEEGSNVTATSATTHNLELVTSQEKHEGCKNNANVLQQNCVL